MRKPLKLVEEGKDNMETGQNKAVLFIESIW